ncbi:hypothetical protein [Streptomyces sasae]|uniref:hypothetical protein n=1 Tax=Streptomyces sasae TaxID=1266772 RepID=UPI002930FF22|nr:hypothetical protein [Streptomyces sasae]
MTITTTALAPAGQDPSDWLAPIRNRLNAATPGPWTVQNATFNGHVLNHCVGTNDMVSYGDCIAELDVQPDGRDAANADFIAHAPTDIQQLLAHIDQLTQRLATAEAAFPGITHLVPGKPVELTIFRTEHDTIPCGLFTSRAAARACGSDLSTRDDDRIDVTHAWIPDHSELDAEPPAEDLSLFGPGGEDDETVTNYAIVPLTLYAAYDPQTWQDEA